MLIFMNISKNILENVKKMMAGPYRISIACTRHRTPPLWAKHPQQTNIGGIYKYIYFLKKCNTGKKILDFVTLHLLKCY